MRMVRTARPGRGISLQPLAGSRPQCARCALPVAGLLVSAAFLGTAEARSSVVSAKGSLTSQSVTGATGTSPIGLCAVGEVKGTFKRPVRIRGEPAHPRGQAGSPLHDGCLDHP